MNLEKYKRLSIKWNIAMTKIASKNLMMNCYIKQWSIKK